MQTSLPRFGLRSKLMVVALTLLAIPWIGYRYVIEMQQFLRANEENVLQEHARIVAAALGERSSLLTQPIAEREAGADHLFVRPLPSPMQLDGYSDDWALHRDRRQPLRVAATSSEPVDLAATLSLGSYESDLYLLFEVSDDRLVYRDPRAGRDVRADRVELWLYDASDRLLRLTLATSAPGWVDVVATDARGARLADQSWATAVRGEWQEASGGYAVEVKVPIARLGTRLGAVVYDVDDGEARRDTATATIGRSETGQNLGTVVVAAPEVEHLLLRLVRPGMRAWVVDKSHRVIGLAGGFDETDRNEQPSASQSSSEDSSWQLMYRLLLGLLLQQPASEFQDDLSAASRLDGAEVTTALNGTPATRWRQTPDQRVNILTAAYPIKVGDEVIGVAALEETSNSIVLVRNRAMEMLINLSAAAFLLAVAGSLLLATWLSVRIRRLNREMQAAIGPEGRMASPLQGASANDEIGDIRRSFVQLLERLGRYHGYLEGLARKLSHELRTPMTVVRSSLENLSAGTVAPDSQIYLQRAEEGIRRLDAIVTRMSEASRLEQAVRAETARTFDAVPVVRGCVEGYSALAGAPRFNLRLPDVEVPLRGHPDLFAQMLDKLAANARDFHSVGTAIDVALETIDDMALLSVANEGPGLPRNMGRQIFDSMVSLREERGSEPHLGLGLYIVRLIAEFHGGAVSAEDRSDKPGVAVTVRLPLAPMPP